MGYACPVCAAPQADGEHLAHHLAFTALLHGDDHEAWLDERVPDWAERDPAGLAARVVEHAPATDHEPGTSGGGHDHRRPDPVSFPEQGVQRLDPETRRVVERAREFTRRRRHEDEE